MKKIVSLILVICILSTIVMVCPVASQATTEGTCGKNLIWELDEEGTLTISGTGPMYEYDRVYVYPWYELTYPWSKAIHKIVINEGVTTIGNYAFYNTSVKSIEIPNTVTIIGEHSMELTNNLTEISIPDSVKQIGKYAFGDSAVKKVIIGDGVAEIDDDAFRNCESLSSINIPGSVKRIGKQAFSWCMKLNTVILMKGVQSIDDEAFYGCLSLSRIYFPETVESLGSNMFGNGSLAYIDVDENSKHYIDVDGVLFNKEKTALLQYPEYKAGESYVVPNIVDTIGDCAFSGCSNLIKITLPDDIVSVGRNAFNNCSHLQEITIPQKINHIGEGAFSHCEKLSGHIDIPGGVTEIKASTFARCESLSSLTLPDTIVKIGDNAFSYCGASINIPESVVEIGEEAFAGCAMSSITIPGGVKKISDWAFSSCTYLSRVNVAEGVQYIGENAFRYCFKLTDIYLPKSVVSIGNDAFNSATGLKTVYYSGDILDWPKMSIGTGNTILLNAEINFCDINRSELMREFPLELMNSEFEKVFYTCSDFCDEALKNVGVGNSVSKVSEARKIWAAYRHQCKNMFPMMWTNITKKFYDVIGRDWLSNYDKEIDRTLLNFMNSFCSNYDGVLASTVQNTAEQFSDSFLRETYDLLNEVHVNELVEGLAKSSNGRYDISACRKIVKEFGTKTDMISDVLKEFGIAAEFTDVLLTAFMTDCVYNDTIDLMLEKVPIGTDLHDGLLRTKERQGVGSAEYFLETYISKQALKKILEKSPGWIASAVGMIFDNVNITGATFNFARSIIAISVQAIDMLPGSVEMDDIMNTLVYLNNAHLFHYTMTNEISNLMKYEVDGIVLSDDKCKELLSEYEVLYTATIVSMRMALENAKRLTDSSDRKNMLDSCIKVLDNWTFDIYIDLCIDNAQNDYSKKYIYIKSDEGITITGIMNVATATVSLMSSDVEPEGKMLVIPDYIDGLPVVGIGANAFAGNGTIDSVIMSSNVKFIGEGAFEGCTALNTVILGDGVETVGDYAFKDCSGLETVKLSQNIKTLGEYCFADCSILRGIDIPINTQKIMGGAFARNTSLERLSIHGNDTQISETILDNTSRVTIYAAQNSLAAVFANDNNINHVITQPDVSDIAIKKLPDNLTCDVGDNPDDSGMELEITFSDGMVESVTEGWVLACDVSSGGQKTVYVYYDDYVAQYTIDVNYSMIIAESIKPNLIDNGISCDLTLSPYDVDSAKVRAYVAVYDCDYNLLGINATTVEPSRTDSVAFKIDVKVDNILPGYTYAIYLWDEAMEPYIDFIQYYIKGTESDLQLCRIK